MDVKEKALELHREWNGKLDTVPKMDISTREDLALAYTPGVAEPCKVIAKDPAAVYEYTQKANTIAVITDGSAVLGLGNIGPRGRDARHGGQVRPLQGTSAGVDAFPLCVDTQDVDEMVKTIALISQELRRHQPGGHLRPPLLRGGAPPEGGAATSPSSTTTSTAPPSSWPPP